MVASQHQVRVSRIGRLLLVSCTCGWRPPVGVDGEDAVVVHIAQQQLSDKSDPVAQLE